MAGRGRDGTDERERKPHDAAAKDADATGGETVMRSAGPPAQRDRDSSTGAPQSAPPDDEKAGGTADRLTREPAQTNTDTVRPAVADTKAAGDAVFTEDAAEGDGPAHETHWTHRSEAAPVHGPGGANGASDPLWPSARPGWRAFHARDATTPRRAAFGPADPSARAVAGAFADALGLPVALVDDGTGEVPTVLYAEGDGAEAARLQRLWRESETDEVARHEPAMAGGQTPHTGPAARKTEAPAIVAGFDEALTAVSAPLTLAGSKGWVAALGPADHPLPANAAAIARLAATGSAARAGAETTPDHEGPQSSAERIAALEAQNRTMAQAQRLMGIGTLTFDFAAGTLSLSPEAEKLFAPRTIRSLEDVAGAFAPYDRDNVLSLLEGKGAPRTFTFERLTEGLDGAAPRWLGVRGEVSRLNGVPRVLFAALRDLSEERRELERAHDAATHDPLTGLLNRAGFADAMERAALSAASTGACTGVMIMDVDGLRDVNERYGLDCGHKVLVTIAAAIEKAVRAVDTLLRIGNDEFAVVFGPAPTATAIADLARTVHAAACCLAETRAGTLPMTVSSGFAVTPHDLVGGLAPDQAADHALFDARAAGAGKMVRFVPSIRAKHDACVQSLNAVAAALDRGEFTAYYQPKISLMTGAIAGFEALIRWRHPTRGVLSPGAFHQALADPHLGARLSDASLHAAFETAATLNRDGTPFGHISINLNATQLSRTDLVESVAALRRTHALAPDLIQFEVLENVLISEGDTIRDNLVALAGAGHPIALDDFGTGFASLTHVREPFIAAVKLDRSFVTNAWSSAYDRQIVSAIVQIARRLNLTLVAEGIEDEITLKQLRAVGCTVGQGFVFAPAVPREVALDFAGCQARIDALLTALDKPIGLLA